MPLLATQLKAREKAIDAALEAAQEHFAVIGVHLTAIRDGELYKEAYKTFEDYVLIRWEFSRGHAYRLISAAKTLESLSPMEARGVEMPAAESQLRELAKVSPDPGIQQEVWETAQNVGQTSQPAAATIVHAGEIVTTRAPVNHESHNIELAIVRLERQVKPLSDIAKLISAAFDAKYAVSSTMSNRKAKFDKQLGNLSEQIDFVLEHVGLLREKWDPVKKQVDS
jgi:hypothetical protein